MKKTLIHFVTFLIQHYFLFVLKIYLHIIRFFRKRIYPTTKKNISFISTHDQSGGAAKIAYALSLGIQETYATRLFVKVKSRSEAWINQLENRDYPFFQELFRREAIKKGWIEFTGFHVLHLLKNPFYVSSSIVHLHNLHGEFFSPGLFNNVLENKKVIWTLHDESFITGHCSCTLGCNNWQQGCGQCPDLKVFPSINYDNTSAVLTQKKKWILELQPIIVAPSNWLADRVRKAYPTLLNLHVIPNGVDTQIFCPMDKTIARKELGFPLEQTLVLFVAEFSTTNPFKGGEIVRSLIADPEYEFVQFVTVGGDSSSAFSNHIAFPYVYDEKRLSQLYAACDVLLYPTRADNLPLVVLEAMACGTPVIASAIGGIPEIISSTSLGFLVEEYWLENRFKSQLNYFMTLSLTEKQNLQINIVQHIKNNFSLVSMIDSYKLLYTSQN